MKMLNVIWDWMIPSKNSYSKHFNGQFLQIHWKVKRLDPVRSITIGFLRHHKEV